MENKTVLVGEFKHETNTFSPAITDRKAFQARWELYGDEIPEYFRDTESPVGGFIDRSSDHGFDLVYSVAANAMPGGRVTKDAFEYYTNELVDTAEELGDDLDGIFLSLHGAMAPEGKNDGEGPLLEALREVVGDVPIVATLDPHTNLADRTAELADGLFAYETYPHIDHAERGRQAADFLADSFSGGVDPVIELERPPILPDFPRMNTREGPMAEIAERARDLEERDGVRKVNLLFGFNHGDTPSTGVSVAVLADEDRELAQSTARELSEYVWEHRDNLVSKYPTTDEAVARAREVLGSDGTTDEGPLLLIDVGDNPGGGGVEDRTDLLGALVDSDVEFEEGGIALVWDPDSVTDCIDAGVGESVSLSLGHHVDDPSFPGEPLEIEGYVKALTNGEFVNHGLKEKGVRQHLGKTARVVCDGIDVLITERRYSPNDTETWRHVGIPPERADLLVLKSVNHFRADYEPLASEIVLVDTPGSFAIDLTRFEFEHLNESKVPLVSDDEITYPSWTCE
jgi:microcystin degradation protein MlrC